MVSTLAPLQSRRHTQTIYIGDQNLVLGNVLRAIAEVPI